MARVRPEHGGTIELKLERTSETEVTYETTLATPASEWRGDARVTLANGHVELAPPEEMPAWLGDLARAVLRSIWRAHASAGWPRRITRWRAGPEGG
jgi:hypothetical protein